MDFVKTHKNKICLSLILILAGFLSFWGVWANDWGNKYYAAGVRSMLTSWHNFFFVSFEPSGSVSIDKPPLGLWVQCLFAKIFGFHTWSLILPQSLATVASVYLLYVMLKEHFDEKTGLLGGLFLATTPIFIAVGRTNNIESTMIFCMIVAVFFLLKDKLFISMLFVGLGFNIKMAQAFMILPAIYLTYIFFAKTTWTKRIINLLIATIVLAGVSFAWCVTVDLTPPELRPYVGGSTENSTLELALGYNGIKRVLNNSIVEVIPQAFISSLAEPSDEWDKTGQPGIMRLFKGEMGEIAGWYLPFALLGLIIVAIRWRNITRPLFFFASWFAVLFMYFSFGGVIHPYYAATFAPATAAMAAVGISIVPKKIPSWVTGTLVSLTVICPLLWSFTPMVYTGRDLMMPTAGFTLKKKPQFSRYVEKEVKEFLDDNYNGEKYMVGVRHVEDAYDFIIEKGKGVFVLGGFLGQDNIVSLSEFKNMVSRGEIRYFMPSFGITGNSVNNSILRWIGQNGAEVTAGKTTVYDLKL